jgi:alpha-L-fucosidase
MSDFSWWDEARLGLFVHWDHASQQGYEVSWPMVGGVFSLPKGQRATVAEYTRSAATFHPTAWDPTGIVELAKQAGCGYVVLTSRHHNGWSLYRTAHSDWSVAMTPYAGDPVRELMDATRAAGLRAGLYYSLSDWHHPDYPAWADDMQPYQLGRTPALPTEEQAERFRAYLMAQLEELATGYGPISEWWFDGQWERPTQWWHPEEIRALLQRLSPGCIINDRLPNNGDFATPEQFVPPKPLDGRWETCLTMNHSWGHVPEDSDYKSTRELVHTLCEIAGRGGNLLLNVSPRGDGSLPPEQVERLQGMARWWGLHGEAIRGTRPGLEPWQFYGPSTQKGDTTYVFLLMRPYDSVTLRGVPVRRVRSVRVVGTGAELRFRTRTGIIESLLPDPPGELVVSVPDDQLDADATVLAVEIEPTKA